MSSTQTDRPKRDIYQQITDQILAAIATSDGPAEMPWHRSGVTTNRPTNAFTGEPYQGVNIVSLWAAATLNAFGSGHWATFKQWRCLGAHVRKGEKGSPIVFYKPYVAGASANEQRQNVRSTRSDPSTLPVRWFARASWAFNAEQVGGWSPPQPTIRSPAELVSEAETFVQRTGAVIHHGGDFACYRPARDIIDMPARDAFTGTATSSATESYYAVLFHELTHWSGHGSRLDRQLTGRFGDAAYAMEELIAELGASFLCADCHIANHPRADHARYIAGWLKVLQDDKRAIFTATRKASEATTYLTAFQTIEVNDARQHVEKAGCPRNSNSGPEFDQERS